LEKYRRDDYVLISYHVHIPLPDPMTNPATLARQKFYGVSSSPSYFVDGESSGGGGGADAAKSLFESRVDPMVVKHLSEPPEAALKLQAKTVGSTVKVTAAASKVTNTSAKLRLHVALVEDTVRYSGENGLRFHDMVVRAMAEPPAGAAAVAAKPAAPPTKEGEADKPAAVPLKTLGFALKAGQGGTFEYTFDVKKAEAEALAHLQDFETNTRKGEYSFRQKRHTIDSGKLSIVAFVQDEATKKILQTVYVKLPAAKSGN
jgi:hypothetical protein